MVIKLKDSINKLPINQILATIIETGLENDANYIHIEPMNDVIRINHRISGNLYHDSEISKKRFKNLSEKIKKLANIQTGYTDLISNGNFKYVHNNQIYSLKVYILPTINGEKITFKIQNESPVSTTLEALGFWGMGLDVIRQSTNLKSGLILVTGPSDSGKSKTMATILSSIENQTISIGTLEDPVEYKIPRASQTQINHRTNLNFVNGMKILLKQDNDVIMLSELTDMLTISEALDSVMHKKLFISALNSDSAVETINKLLDYGISPASLAYALKIVINQRLVRKLCQNCKQQVDLDKKTADKINKLFDLNNPSNMRYLHNLELEYYHSKLGENKKVSAKTLSTSETKIKKLWINKSSGCAKCMNTGFKGRTVVSEILKNTQEIERLIVTKSKDLLINKQAVKEGMVNYLVDGLIKVLVGETTIDEIMHLTKLSYLA
jgi:type II secretory ATPase GspE/PulE/Tfp pilus assembly ATPase PilB-like protein